MMKQNLEGGQNPFLGVTKSTRNKYVTFTQHTSYDKIGYNTEPKN